MKPVQLRNISAEDEYFRYLARWQDATKHIERYDTKALAWLWQQLESAYRRVGYDFGDREGIK